MEQIHTHTSRNFSVANYHVACLIKNIPLNLLCDSFLARVLVVIQIFNVYMKFYIEPAFFYRTGCAGHAF